MNFFNWLSGATVPEIPNIYPFPIKDADFVKNDLQALYSRILTEALERTAGIPENKVPLLWDNCLASEVQTGLISLLSKAMIEKSKLYLVYDKATDVIRKATQPEEREIEKAYREGQAKKAKGVYITFEKYDRTDMLKIYSGMDYCTAGSLWKTMNISKAVQIKMSDMRASTGAVDSKAVTDQAVQIAKGLKDGKDILLDAKDIVETAKPDLTATNSAEDFTTAKISKYSGMPETWLTGEASKGLGDSGRGDAKSVERGLKGYYFPILKPVIETLFGIKTTFKSEDFEQLSTSLTALEVFDRTSEEHLSKENKTKLVNKFFGLPEDSEGDQPEEVTPPAPSAVPGNQPPRGGQPPPQNAAV